jgi:ubiquinone/menaquinone biosynthesis C-methylase UbiE
MTLKIDIGCGKNKREGFVGVDSINFPGVDHVLDVGHDVWPWEDGSVDEAHCSHMVEHLKADERIHFANELYRVLKLKGTALVITPHWSSTRAYGDLTHQWPPVSEFWYFYLNKGWREVNAPHNQAYTCDFDSTHGHGVHAALQTRNQEFQQFALAWYKEAATDLYVTLIKSR